MPEYMKLKAVAAALGVSVKTLYTLRDRGLVFTKIGGATRISRDELERFLAANRDGADTAKASRALATANGCTVEG